MPEQNKSLVYILSQRYSGSTLLSFLLGTHPDVTTIGERRKFYTHFVEVPKAKAMDCSCGKPFPQCEYWLSIMNEINENLGDRKFNHNPTEFRLSNNKVYRRIYNLLFQKSIKWNTPILQFPFARTLAEHRIFNNELIKACLKLSNADVFLDSSKSIEQLLFLSTIQDLNIKIIWLSRDPRAQVNSAMKYNPWNVEEATENWVNEMDRNSYWLNKLKLPFHSLTYEDLCTNPKKEMKQIFNFTGLHSDDFSLSFKQKEQHIMGNYNMRMDDSNKIEERIEWKSELDETAISKIEQITAEYRSYYSKSSSFPSK